MNYKQVQNIEERRVGAIQVQKIKRIIKNGIIIGDRYRKWIRDEKQIKDRISGANKQYKVNNLRYKKR